MRNSRKPLSPLRLKRKRRKYIYKSPVRPGTVREELNERSYNPGGMYFLPKNAGQCGKGVGNKKLQSSFYLISRWWPSLAELNQKLARRVLRLAIHTDQPSGAKSRAEKGGGNRSQKMEKKLAQLLSLVFVFILQANGSNSSPFKMQNRQESENI